MLRRVALALAVPLILAGCSGGDDDDDVPANPTWDSHVEEILTTGCATCHLPTPLNGAPDGFRLDVYDSDGSDLGAFDMRCDIRNRAVLGNPSFMPPSPTPPLSSTERETLDRWVDQGGLEVEGGAAGVPCN